MSTLEDHDREQAILTATEELKDAHDVLSEALEDPDAGNDAIRDAAIAICEQLNILYPKMEKSLACDALELIIGNYSIMADVDDDGDLQIRVYPMDKDGQPWDHPIDTFNVEKSEVDALTPC